jgi:hypothetical protein
MKMLGWWVDAHKDTHYAVVLDERGVLVAGPRVPSHVSGIS